MSVAGVDPSLTATAVCLHRGDVTDVAVHKTKPKAKTSAGKVRRMWEQVAFVSDNAAGSELVLIEAPSFGSQGSATRDLAGLWWMLYAALTADELPVAVVPPSALKLWATGKGNADKFLVGQHISKRWPEMELTSDDEADALVLASMGLHVLNRLPWAATEYQGRALEKVEWPTGYQVAA